MHDSARMSSLIPSLACHDNAAVQESLHDVNR
jgi:hypothetical protein